MKKPAPTAPSCDWRAGAREPGARKSAPRSRIVRGGAEGGWGGIRTERYKQPDGSWASVIRRTIVGGLKGERTKFHLRYFEVAPGGNTSFECHEHEHVVVAVRGSGVCRIKNTRHALNPMDVAYIAPGAAHQLLNPNDEPFGFLCIVDAERDSPVPVK